MSADVLREAAAKVREAATDCGNCGRNPWFFTQGDEERFDGYEVWTFFGNHHWTVATADFTADAEHIALWHPAVALAVADWLDAIVERDPSGQSVEAEPALRVARLILGADQ